MKARLAMIVKWLGVAAMAGAGFALLFAVSDGMRDAYVHRADSRYHLSPEERVLLTTLQGRVDRVEHDIEGLNTFNDNQWTRINEIVEQRVTADDHKRLVQLPLKIGSIEARLEELHRRLVAIEHHERR